jgi:hypothetical protein
MDKSSEQPYPLTGNYQTKLNRFVVEYGFFNQALDEKKIHFIWQYFNGFPIPELIVDKLDGYWHKLCLQKDKALLDLFLHYFTQFIEEKLTVSHANKAWQKQAKYQLDYENMII